MDRRQSIKAVARKTAMGGTFQAALRPVDVLALDDIAERWASYSGQPPNILLMPATSGLRRHPRPRWWIAYPG